jgi:hypothetical protein
MNNKAYNLASYSFTTGEEILLDANIWLYLFPAPGNPQYHFANQYSSAFAKLIQAKARLILDPIVLSEYLMWFPVTGQPKRKLSSDMYS